MGLQDMTAATSTGVLAGNSSSQLEKGAKSTRRAHEASHAEELDPSTRHKRPRVDLSDDATTEPTSQTRVTEVNLNENHHTTHHISAMGESIMKSPKKPESPKKPSGEKRLKR